MNTPCLMGSCSGHGACDASAGFPVCTCLPGWASTPSASCVVCALGYAGDKCEVCVVMVTVVLANPAVVVLEVVLGNTRNT
jgi:hypothetical protein